MSDLPSCVASETLLLDLIGVGFLTGLALALGFCAPWVLRFVFRKVHGVRDGLE